MGTAGQLTAPGGALGDALRAQFPVFVGRAARLSFLDSAASSQKPARVIDRLATYLRHQHANIHRGAYELSAHATELYDEARERVRAFMHARSSNSIIFTRGTTESVNLVAQVVTSRVRKGDSILLTMLEHHSNIVPWQLLADRVGAHVAFADIHADASLDLSDFSRKLQELKPKIVAFTHTSNAFGTVLPVAELVALAHDVGALVLVDAAQAAPHAPIDVFAWGADFVAWSGHKAYGPTGIGVLFGREELLNELPPYHGGGDMIERVSTLGSTYALAPRRFEAGTPAIGEAIALGEAVAFLSELGFERVAQHESTLLHHGFELLRAEEGVTLHGPMTNGGHQASILAFSVDGVHPHDLATVADEFGVQIRAGHHCAMPALERLGLPATARASLGVYSDRGDFPPLLEAIRKARKMFRA